MPLIICNILVKIKHFARGGGVEKENHKKISIIVSSTWSSSKYSKVIHE
jgi:hypothetical protein